jgi:hypothetical protein
MVSCRKLSDFEHDHIGSGVKFGRTPKRNVQHTRSAKQAARRRRLQMSRGGDFPAAILIQLPAWRWTLANPWDHRRCIAPVFEDGHAAWCVVPASHLLEMGG